MNCLKCNKFEEGHTFQYMCKECWRRYEQKKGNEMNDEAIKEVLPEVLPNGEKFTDLLSDELKEVEKEVKDTELKVM